MYKLLIILLTLSISLFAEDTLNNNGASDYLNEFKVKREENFEFEKKPVVKKQNDAYYIQFETKGFCDVTIVIENTNGKIVRHLVSGVLGPKAPLPLQSNTKVQNVLWDGKDDFGNYVPLADIGESNVIYVRVSLGLKPQFERTLFWSPKKRLGHQNPPMFAAKEGVYIAESSGVEQVKLFSHDGEYIRTVYPFPNTKISNVNQLSMHTFIQDGITKPLKRSYLQSTLLKTCDDSYYHGGEEPIGIISITANGGKVAVAGEYLNRLGEDGSSCGLPVYGPLISVTVKEGATFNGSRYMPHSMAFSPNGKYLYLTGYRVKFLNNNRTSWLNAVYRMKYDSNEAPELWLGSDISSKFGSGEKELHMPTAINIDEKGRIYICDYMNDRIQVFDEDKKLLKSIAINKPTRLGIHKKSGDIFVFSYLILENGWDRDKFENFESKMFHLGGFDNPIVKSQCNLPLLGYDNKAIFNFDANFQHEVELDSYAEVPTVWIANGKNGARTPNHNFTNYELQHSAKGGAAHLFQEKDGKLVLIKKFNDDVIKEIVRDKPAILSRQRLSINPVTGKLYVIEGDSGAMKGVNQLLEITPDSGAIKTIDLPIGCEDICFDATGLIYLRTDNLILRYDPTTWKEIPFDYGVEKDKVQYSSESTQGAIISGLQTPGHRSFNFWHLGGFDINLNGHILATTCNGFEMDGIPSVNPSEPQAKMKIDGQPYKPTLFKGRMRWGELHIWDKHGKLIKEDAVPGVGHLNGVAIDQEDNIYMLVPSKRIWNGKQTDTLDVDSTGTIVKVKFGKNKVLSNSKNIPVPLSNDEMPKRSIDLQGMTTGWVEGAEWFFGGVGFSKPGGCICWNARFCKDYLNRSFAPEYMNYSIGIIDSSGNLIVRVGKYGNVDDGKPIISEGGPKNSQSIGGDEVSLFYANYVTSHTDKRLFIADAGNSRILSVKLNYHREEKATINK